MQLTPVKTKGALKIAVSSLHEENAPLLLDGESGCIKIAVTHVDANGAKISQTVVNGGNGSVILQMQTLGNGCSKTAGKHVVAS